MLESITKMTQEVLQITKEFSSEKIVFEEILNKFAKDTDLNLVFVDSNGKFIFEYLQDNHFSLNNKLKNDCKMIDIQLNEQLKNIVEIKTNLTSESLYIKTAEKEITSKFIFAVSPVSVFTERIGSIILYGVNNKLSAENILLLDTISTLVSILYLHIKNEEIAKADREINLVKSAIGTLSYSELEAVVHIFNELNAQEGLLVASKVADKVGITRSVIVNALRKLESAGVIESRSLGMKGTYIKVLNEFLTSEIDKLKK